MPVRWPAKPPSKPACLIWIALSLFWIDAFATRMHKLHASGRAVTGWQYAQVSFWVLILIFWSVLAVAAWRRPRTSE